MGVFGIFAAILTFGYAIYYCVNICIDLNVIKKKKGGSSEVITVSGKKDKKKADKDSDKTVDKGVDNSVPSDHDSAVYVEEFDDGSFGIKEPNNQEEVVSPEGGSAIDKADSEELEQKRKIDKQHRDQLTKKAEEQCVDIEPQVEGSVPSDELDKELDELNRNNKSMQIPGSSEDEVYYGD